MSSPELSPSWLTRYDSAVKGDQIHISTELEAGMIQMGFSPERAKSVAARFAGTEQTVLEVWFDGNNEERIYVTIAEEVNIPIEFCGKIRPVLDSARIKELMRQGMELQEEIRAATASNPPSAKEMNFLLD